MYINYVECGTAVARANKINTNAFDASDIFRDVYIRCYVNYVYCGTEISVAGYLKFSRNEVQGRPLFTNLEILEVLRGPERIFHKSTVRYTANGDSCS